MAQKHTLDCLGEACPVPLIKTQKKFKTMDVGDTLLVAVDHSCAIKNIPEWAQKENFNCEIEEVAGGSWEIFLEKNH